MNASVNRVVRPLLQSRWHGVLSGRLLLVTAAAGRLMGPGCLKVGGLRLLA
jgi:hypothetical protein